MTLSRWFLFPIVHRERELHQHPFQVNSSAHPCPQGSSGGTHRCAWPGSSWIQRWWGRSPRGSGWSCGAASAAWAARSRRRTRPRWRPAGRWPWPVCASPRRMWTLSWAGAAPTGSLEHGENHRGRGNVVLEKVFDRENEKGESRSLRSAGFSGTETTQFTSKNLQTSQNIPFKTCHGAPENSSISRFVCSVIPWNSKFIFGLFLVDFQLTSCNFSCNLQLGFRRWIFFFQAKFFALCLILKASFLIWDPSPQPASH